MTKAQAAAGELVYIPELDGLRGIAALLVVFFHGSPSLFFMGWSGVDLFFVLSGYLITSIILSGIAQKNFFYAFYGRRILRIWPMYFMVLGALLLINALSPRGYPTEGLPYHLLFVQNIQRWWLGSPPEFVHAFGISWSVAIEEQYYLIWPFVVGLTLRSFPYALIPLSCALIAVSVGARSFGFFHNILLTRMDGLAIGSLIAVAQHPLTTSVAMSGWLQRVAPAVLTLSLGAMAVIAAYHSWDPEPQPKTPVFLIVSCLYGAILVLVLNHRGRMLLAPLRWRYLRWIGLISYSLYLTHPAVMSYTPPALARIGIADPQLVGALVWIAVFFIPASTYHVIERPFLSLKRRFRYHTIEHLPVDY